MIANMPLKEQNCLLRNSDLIYLLIILYFTFSYLPQHIVTTKPRILKKPRILQLGLKKRNLRNFEKIWIIEQKSQKKHQILNNLW